MLTYLKPIVSGSSHFSVRGKKTLTVYFIADVCLKLGICKVVGRCLLSIKVNEALTKYVPSFSLLMLICLILSVSGVRPFGVSLLVAGYDDKGPQLYQVF